MKSPIGQPLRRKEDRRLLTGAGRYIDDLALPSQAHGVVLRSPHAHARLGAIDTKAARAAPGVLAVLIGADCRADGLMPIPHGPNGIDHLDPSQPAFAPGCIKHGPPPGQPVLAQGRVRHVGEAVAFVVAETAEAARDAAELVAVDYAPLSAVAEVRAAIAPGAPRLWDERPDNLMVAAEQGDKASVAAAMIQAHRIVRLASVNQRVNGAPMEPRGALGEYDAASGSLTLHSASQGVHRHKMPLVAVLGTTPDRLRVMTGDVGGGFGIRSPCYPEYALVLWAARRLGRPVKWSATRSESFLSDFQARDFFIEGALALAADGRFLGLSIDYLGNLGAYPVSFAVMANVLRMAAGVYDIPALHVAVRGAVSNTVPVGVYRGAGRPESNFMLERLVDMAAAELGIERAELRRRNAIGPTQLPYRSPLGHVYDTGAFALNMERALAAIGWNDFPARRKAAAARGMRAGIGLANYLESPTGFPEERTHLRVLPEGRVTAAIGTQASGQGHETSFAQVVAATLELPLDEVAVIFGDSALLPVGGGSHSDRSMRLGGTILLGAAEEIVARGRRLAAHCLEADERDIAYAAGHFAVAGTDRGIGLYELAAAALERRLPAALQGPLAADAAIARRLHAHPTGCAACELELDPETGAWRIRRYVTVDDVGTVINPMIVEGQVHGGIAQGLGQALFEHCRYDEATGQLLAGSFLDYAMPRADDLPSFAVANHAVAAASNPLGIKGAGECGTTPAAAAAINALCDALGVRHLEMPATPERIWRAARGG